MCEELRKAKKSMALEALKQHAVRVHHLVYGGKWHRRVPYIGNLVGRRPRPLGNQWDPTFFTHGPAKKSSTRGCGGLAIALSKKH
jgi:hypothetical protein